MNRLDFLRKYQAADIKRVTDVLIQDAHEDGYEDENMSFSQKLRFTSDNESLICISVEIHFGDGTSISRSSETYPLWFRIYPESEENREWNADLISVFETEKIEEGGKFFFRNEKGQLESLR